MTEYGITWSGRKHIVGHRNQSGIPFAACNATTDLYLKPALTHDHLRKAWKAAPMCKRCAKIEAAAAGFSEGIPKEKE